MPILKPMLLVLCLWPSLASSDAQSTAVRTFDHFAVTIGPEEFFEGTWFRIDWNNGQVATFLVSDVFGPPTLARDLHVYGTGRLIVQFGQTFVLVDPGSGAVIDRFAVLRSARSPTGRYLAIQRHTPNGVPFADAVYSIYDLEKNATENRPPGAGDTGAGVIIYPTANVVAQRYSVATHQDDAHDLLSPLMWLSPHLLALVDYHASAATLVLADVEMGVSQFKSAKSALSASQFLKPNTEFGQLKFVRVKNIEPLSVTGTTLTLNLVFEPSRLLQLLELGVEAARPQ